MKKPGNSVPYQNFLSESAEARKKISYTNVA